MIPYNVSIEFLPDMIGEIGSQKQNDQNNPQSYTS